MKIKERQLDFIVIFLSIIACVIIGFLLGKDINYDLANYHYYNGYAFLTGRINLDWTPGGIQSYLNPLLDVPTYLGIKYLPPLLYSSLIAAVQAINPIIIYYILKLFLRNNKYWFWLSAGGALITIIGAGFISEIGNTMGDAVASIPLLLSVYFVCKYFLSKNNNYQYLALLLAGISGGLKLTLIPFTLAVVIVLGINCLFNFRKDWQKIPKFLLALIAGIILVHGLWSAVLVSNFGNPVFPFFNKVFNSEYYPAQNFTDARFSDKALWKKAIAPFIYVIPKNFSSELNYSDTRYFLALVLLGLISVRQIKKKSYPKEIFDFKIDTLLKAYLILTFVAFVSFYISTIQFNIYRYLVPAEILFSLSLVLGSAFLFKQEKRAVILLGVIIVLLALTRTSANWGREDFNKTSDYFGLNSAEYADVKNANVFMLEISAPIGFIVPSLHPSNNYIKINEYLGFPTLVVPSNKMVTQRIDPKKEQYALVEDNFLAPSRKTVIGEITLDLPSCRPIYTKSNILTRQIMLCKAQLEIANP